MFKNLKIYTLLGIFSLSILSSCSQYDSVLKGNDMKAKYKMAIELYEKGKFERAAKLFEQAVPNYRGTPQAERITFYLAESYYGMADYLIAAYYYERFVKSYPESSKIEEVAYKQAYCYYLDSPKFSLDQENTVKAMAELQKYINRYSESEHSEEANKMIAELSGKLEKKDFQIAKQYMRLENYKAADISFGNFISDYPDSEYREEAFYFKFVCLFEYARNSFYTKQKERYINAKTAFLLFEKKYPESENLKEAQKYYEDVLEGLKKVS